MRHKKASIGSSINLMVEVLLLSIVVSTVYIFSSMFYAYYIDVKNVEAFILETKIQECIAPENIMYDFPNNLNSSLAG